MAARINSIASTFSSSISSPKSSSISWNPHKSSLSITHKSSLLDLYGSPPPLPLRPISAIRDLIPLSKPTTKLPSSAPVSCLRNGVVRSVSLGSILKGKRRAVVVGVSKAFSPRCEKFVRRVESAEASKAAEIIACVAVENVFVMEAWGEHLAVEKSKWRMVSDGEGEIWKGVGGLEIGTRFWLSVNNGIVTSLRMDKDCDDGDEI